MDHHSDLYAFEVQPMGNMARVVDTESDRKDDIDAGDDVNGDAPEVEEANNIYEGSDDHDEGEEDHENVAEEEGGDDGHTEDGQQEVPHQLEAYDLIRLPGRVHLSKGQYIVIES